MWSSLEASLQRSMMVFGGRESGQGVMMKSSDDTQASHHCISIYLSASSIPSWLLHRPATGSTPRDPPHWHVYIICFPKKFSFPDGMCFASLSSAGTPLDKL